MAQQANHALPRGYPLGEYRIAHQISLGGFSIVYLAHDAAGNAVAIKEYLPNSLALRGEGEVEPQVSPEHAPAFRYGLRCFFEEGRALARLSHPNLVHVLNFFRTNGTVYLVMEFEHGRTLQEFIHRHPEAITENFLRIVFTRLLNGLREVHAHKLLHLDIKPGNIFMRNDRTPVLIDFGAARQTLLRDTPMLKPMYTPGYASPEHHGQRELLGPWSDIYSIGASMYACIEGCAPQPANKRLTHDELPPAVERWRGRFSPELLSTIDWCLQLDHLDRPQSVFSLQKALTAPVAAGEALVETAGNDLETPAQTPVEAAAAPALPAVPEPVPPAGWLDQLVHSIKNRISSR